MACLSCENNVVWRGHFDATGSETAVNLTIYGGECAYASDSMLKHLLTASQSLHLRSGSTTTSLGPCTAAMKALISCSYSLKDQSLQVRTTS